MPSLVTRIDRLEQSSMSGFEAAIREMSDDALLAIIQGWDIATWGRMLAEADPAEFELVVDAMRQYGPGASRHG